MLTTEEFRAWCQYLQIRPETEAFITSIRSSPPVHKVRVRANNVSESYPSRKMQYSIQFESHLELWSIYTLEWDEDVLEYYDQPTHIPLQYYAKSGRPTTQWHTPDFFVLRKSGAGFEEWKHAKSLDKLAMSMSNRYQRDPMGRWLCPPGEAYAEQLHLYYYLRSSAEYHPLYIQNLKSLQDFWAHHVSTEIRLESLVLEILDAYPGMSVDEFVHANPHLSVDVIWSMLSKCMIFTALEASLLTHHEHVFLYRSGMELAQAKAQASSAELVRSLPSHLIFDGRLWQAEIREEEVTLQPEAGLPLSLTLGQFQRMVADGEFQTVTAATPSPMTEDTRWMLSHASLKALEAANRRLYEIRAYVCGEAITVTPRSVQRWIAFYRSAKEQYGCGYLGLLDHIANRGNRTAHIPDASLQLLKTHLKEHYATPQPKRAATIYRLYREACWRQQIPPVSERTFYREHAKFTTQEIMTLRHRRRAAY